MLRLIRKLIPVTLAAVLLYPSVTAQTLFTCDDMSVSKEDFLKAYHKNNTGEKVTEKSYRDYLDLYIRYKLKVKAAYELRLDTLAAQRTELQNFRAQVAENYLKDEESLDKLVNEAFTRGQQDIHLAHIFIAIPPADTAKAYEKAMEAWTALKKGKKFADVARLYSDDPAARENGGDVGNITVFTLPYELESLAWSTAPGQFSKPYRSKAGYHIFRNLGEKKSLGRIKVAQILISFPPAATEPVRVTARLTAESLYDSLRRGADFARLAKTYSGDNLSYQNGGEMPEFGVGRYDSAFETAAFSLEKDGDFSRPVPSSFGYHIIKRLARQPFPRQFDAGTAAVLKQQVLNDPRVEISRKALYKRICQQAGLRTETISEEDLWAFTDSIVLNKALPSYRSLSYATVLFSFPGQTYTVKAWLDYARTAKSQHSGPGSRTNKQLYSLYMERMALDYYRNHLEEYNKDFAFQLDEFKEGNLLFEIMQKKIWDKASTDSAGLRNYYESHKDKYWWDASADALLFTCSNQKTAESLKAGLQRNVTDWKKMADSLGAGNQADSGRYELAQIPSPDKSNFSPGRFTSFVTSPSDFTVSFSYILNIYHDRSPRNYRDARGFVINDYQTYLEDQWIAGLKKKYVVRVNDGVFASLPK